MFTLQPISLDVARLDSSPFPLDLALVKQHLAEDGTDNDALIQQAALAAIDWAEGFMRRTIFARKHTWVLRYFPVEDYAAIRLPRGKTQSIEKIELISGGQVTTLTGPSSSPVGTDYQESLLGDNGGYVMPIRGADWPSVDYDVPEPVKITFEAGYAAGEIPNQIINGLLFATADLVQIRSQADFMLPGDSTTYARFMKSREIFFMPYRIKRWFE